MEYTIIGQITNTHGIQGTVRVFPLTDSIDRFHSLKAAYIGNNKIKVNIKSAKSQRNLVLLNFVDYDNINLVERFKGEYLYVDETEKVKLPEDRYFISDLIKCQAYNTQGELLGNITSVLEGRGNDVYIITSPNNIESMIPAVAEFIVNVDIKNKKVIIDPIEGMIQ